MLTPRIDTAPQVQQLRDEKDAFDLVETCKFRIRTPEDAARAAAMAAHMFHDPDRVRAGLYELLINAVEHGVLEIGYALKTRLIADNMWQEEVRRRLSLPDNRKKHAEMVVARRQDGVVAVITDPGKGFEWQRYLTIDPARAADTHGRGIAQARSACFDRLTYNDDGTQVVAWSRDAPDIAW